MSELHERICANDDCDNVVPPQSGRGRRAIYCSPPCRPTATGSTFTPLRVEVDHTLIVEGERPTGRIWMVRLRRGIRSVTIASVLKSTSAPCAGGPRRSPGTRRRPPPLS